MIPFSVIIPTHNPRASSLARTLAGVAAQTYSKDEFETLIIDNASSTPLKLENLPEHSPHNLRIVREPELGLTFARKAGFRSARGKLIVFVDDDNILDPDYLQQVEQAFKRLPRVGAMGGRSIPAYETQLPSWAVEFTPLLALRDPGDSESISTGLRPPGASRNIYPSFAPIGAGMSIRPDALDQWAQESSSLSDRRGAELISSGDNDIVFAIMKAGWEVAYIPTLRLAHLIPASRLEADYLGRLNRGIQKSWTQVLLKHNASPWPAIPRWMVPPRKLKAWFTYRAWSSVSARIRWQGACGHFEGRSVPPP